MLTGREKRSALRRFSEFLNDRILFIEEIFLHHVETYFMERLKTTVSGANKDLKVIKHLLNFAVKRGYAYSNPAITLKKVKPVKKIFRDLSFEEVDHLLNISKRDYLYLYPLVAASYYTGLREKELT